jgi:hypothetical protein
MCVCVCVCLMVCDLETSTITRPSSEVGCCATEEKTRQTNERINVTLRGVRVAIVAVEKQSVLYILNVCLYSCLSYPSCIAHGRIILSGSTIFFHIIS